MGIFDKYIRPNKKNSELEESLLGDGYEYSDEHYMENGQIEESEEHYLPANDEEDFTQASHMYSDFQSNFQSNYNQYTDGL